MCFWIPMSPPLQYLTLTLRNLGFDTFQSNLLIIPYTFVHSEPTHAPPPYCRGV